LEQWTFNVVWSDIFVVFLVSNQLQDCPENVGCPAQPSADDDGAVSSGDIAGAFSRNIVLLWWGRRRPTNRKAAGSRPDEMNGFFFQFT
jgi:hypothetical protein